MAEVFISYRHVSPDQNLADELSKFLQGQNVSCFRDREILIGQNWVQMIEKELRACQCFVCFRQACGTLVQKRAVIQDSRTMSAN